MVSAPALCVRGLCAAGALCVAGVRVSTMLRTTYAPAHEVSLRLTLAPLAQGRTDPTFQRDASGFWLTMATPAGDATLHLRATAKLASGAVVPDDATLADLVNVHGHGRFVITLDPKDKLPGQQPYQGIVPLAGTSVAEVIENYMLRSEQLDTKLWLAADDHVSRGMLLQKLPKEGGTGVAVADDLETWNHTVTLASTLGKEELLSTDVDTLLHRLFWQDTVRVFEPRHPRFQCSCTREKVGNMLLMLGRGEVESALTDLGSLSINCDFCGQHYEFDAVDCAQLFATDTRTDGMQPASDIRH